MFSVGSTVGPQAPSSTFAVLRMGVDPSVSVSNYNVSAHVHRKCYNLVVYLLKRMKMIEL